MLPLQGTVRTYPIVNRPPQLTQIGKPPPLAVRRAEVRPL